MKGVGWGGARRTGVAALALLCAAVVSALVLARIYHLGVPATSVAILVGLPGLYLGWVSVRVAQRDADEAGGLAEVADGLAARLRSQWAREAVARGLNDPYP